MKAMTGLCSAVVAATIALTVPLAAQEFPSRPITMVVPFDPGGGSDLIARTVDKFAAEEFGGNFTFQYRPGAGGHIGTNTVAGASPDGYTIGTFNVPHIALGPVTGVAQYALDDFTYLGQVAADPGAMATAPGSFGSLEEFLTAARDRPGELTLGSADQFGGTHLLALQIADAADVKLTIVPFSGGSQLVAAVLGGHVDAGVAGLPPFMGSREETQFLALTGPDRHDALPEVPTLREQGLDITMITGRIFVAPAGLEDDVTQRLRSGLQTIYEREDFQADLRQSGQFPSWMSGAELRDSLQGYQEEAARLFETVD
jgi:tripartite-type tricarboxylate transporter receptor subunit TctC